MFPPTATHPYYSNPGAWCSTSLPNQNHSYMYRAGLPEAEAHAARDQLLAHGIYGHMVPDSMKSIDELNRGSIPYAHHSSTPRSWMVVVQGKEAIDQLMGISPALRIHGEREISPVQSPASTQRY